MFIKILFKVPLTRFFVAFCKEGRFMWFSLYKKQFGYILKNEGYDLIKINDYHYWQEI